MEDIIAEDLGFMESGGRLTRVARLRHSAIAPGPLGCPGDSPNLAFSVGGPQMRGFGRGFPTDFPVVGLRDVPVDRVRGRGFPTDFPVVGFDNRAPRPVDGRGFPTDFPVVGSPSSPVGGLMGRGFPTDFPVVG